MSLSVRPCQPGTDPSRIRKLVIRNDGRIHQPEYECVRKFEPKSAEDIDDGEGNEDEDDEDTENDEAGGADEHDEDGENDENHGHDEDDEEDENVSQESGRSQQSQAQPLISFIDFIRPFPNVKSLWVQFHPFNEDRDSGYDGLQAAANECDRRRRDPVEAMTLAFPKVTFLSLEVLGTANLYDWTEEMDFLKLSELKCTLKQLELPNLRVWRLDLDEMWGFHAGEPANGMWGHRIGEERGEDSWEVLRDALEYARFPRLREFYMNIEYEVIALSFGVNLCVSTVPIPESTMADSRIVPKRVV